MQKINKILFVIFFSLHFISCGDGFKYMKIWKNEEYKVFYIDSRKIGERVKSTLMIDDKIIEYNIYIGYKGMPIHIIRYAPQNSVKKNLLDTYREMEFLVSDTSKNYPHYLDNGINVNDYYDPTFFKGSYEVDKLKKIVSPVTKKEWEMLNKISILMANKKVNLQPFDSTKILGWFKYEF